MSYYNDRKYLWIEPTDDELKEQEELKKIDEQLKKHTQKERKIRVGLGRGKYKGPPRLPLPKKKFVGLPPPNTKSPRQITLPPTPKTPLQRKFQSLQKYHGIKHNKDRTNVDYLRKYTDGSLLNKESDDSNNSDEEDDVGDKDKEDDNAISGKFELHQIDPNTGHHQNKNKINIGKIINKAPRSNFRSRNSLNAELYELNSNTISSNMNNNKNESLIPKELMSHFKKKGLYV